MANCWSRASMFNLVAYPQTLDRLASRLLGREPQRILAPVVGCLATLGVLTATAAGPAAHAAASAGVPVRFTPPAPAPFTRHRRGATAAPAIPATASPP